MKDYRRYLETLRNRASEAALIRDLTTVPHKRELFTKLAAHLHMLADQVERAMTVANSRASKQSERDGELSLGNQYAAPRTECRPANLAP